MDNTAELEFAARTDTGRVRPQNEDAIAINPICGLAVLADGMGGYNAGEVASGIAVAVTKQTLEDGLCRLPSGKYASSQPEAHPVHQLMVDSIQRANDAILDAAHSEPQYAGMGTTLVTALVQHDKIIIAHVGDSRAYRFRNGELIQITRDHSLLQEQIDAGLIDPALAHYAQYKNLVTRAVGVAPALEVEIHQHQMESGDVYLLCSDGMSDMLQSFEIVEILERHSSLTGACDALVQRANDHGGRDNISVILIKLRSTPTRSDGLLGRFLRWAM